MTAASLWYTWMIYYADSRIKKLRKNVGAPSPASPAGPFSAAGCGTAFARGYGCLVFGARGLNRPGARGWAGIVARSSRI